MKSILLIALVIIFSQTSAKNFISEKPDFGFNLSPVNTEINGLNLSQGLNTNFTLSQTDFQNDAAFCSSKLDFHFDNNKTFELFLNSENNNLPNNKYSFLNSGNAELAAYNFNQRDLKKDPVWPDFLMFGLGFGLGALGAATSDKDDSPFLMGMLGGGIFLATFWFLLEK